ncbi:N-acetylmuramoyl-L-alanine amidase [Algoriphagus marinus]|uniref:N-acetylmuramoyl-L-alanine amidase n=1 Tax=Algoriphagus marinus TaxID=1925762 RepID=UPI00094B7974|nr:N-acetylmuramoyl-L-alanine amidase [Algoriphagus marinus]
MRFHKIFSALVFTSISIALVSCSNDIYRKNNKAHKKAVKEVTSTLHEIPKTKSQSNPETLSITDEWVGTTNFSVRRPNYVIIHHTAQDSLAQTIKTFTLTRTQVSSHYVIGRDGEVVQMLNDYLRSWHAGRGRWGNDTDLNSASIGIELDNNGFEPFTEKQIESLLLVLKRLKAKYGIPTANFIGHSDIAPGRKVDPSPYFPWKRLAEAGYGLWYDEVLDTPNYLEVGSPPENFNTIDALRIIGYDVSDTAAAVQSFKIHFIQRDIAMPLHGLDQLILYNLYKKYR